MLQWRITAAAAWTAPDPFYFYRVSRCSHVAPPQPHRRRAITESDLRSLDHVSARWATLAASDL